MALNIQMPAQSLLAANFAPNGEWSQLYYALQNNAKLNSKDMEVYLNDDGEYTGYTYEEIANIVAAGGVWIDWCGWPMSRVDTDPFGIFGDYPANFDDLARALGSPMGFQGGPPSFSAVPSGFPYERSLVTTGPVQSKGFVANPNSYNTQSGGTYVYSSFAIKYEKGVYFYAAGLNAAQNAGVTFDQYWPFIEQIMYEIIGYQLTTTSGPGCSYYGTYKGQTSSGLFIYERQSGSDIIQTIVDSVCTPVGGVKTITPTNCNANGQYGTYVGTGADFGSVSTDAVYMKQGSGSYTLYVVEPTTCFLKGSFTHTGIFSATGTSATSGSGGTSTGTQQILSDTSGITLSTKDLLYAGLGIGALGLGYWFLKRPPRTEGEVEEDSDDD